MENDEMMVAEYCNNCETEIEMRWDVNVLGYKAFCPVCGERLMLCDECQHRGESGERTGDCDYDSKTDTCRFNKTPHQNAGAWISVKDSLPDADNRGCAVCWRDELGIWRMGLAHFGYSNMSGEFKDAKPTPVFFAFDMKDLHIKEYEKVEFWMPMPGQPKESEGNYE